MKENLLVLGLVRQGTSARMKHAEDKEHAVFSETHTCSAQQMRLSQNLNAFESAKAVRRIAPKS